MLNERDITPALRTKKFRSILTLDLVLLTMIFRYDPDMTQVIPIKLVTLHVPETYVDGLEKLVQSNLYPNRSEAIRIAIRDLLKRELWGT